MKEVIYICDRCGSQAPKLPRVLRFGDQNAAFTRDEDMDLCGVCAKALDEWLEKP